MTPELKQQIIDALEAACGGRCNREYNPCWEYELADKLRAVPESVKPFGYWHKGDTEDESEFHLAADISGDCEFCLPLYLHPDTDAWKAGYKHGAWSTQKPESGESEYD